MLTRAGLARRFAFCGRYWTIGPAETPSCLASRRVASTSGAGVSVHPARRTPARPRPEGQKLILRMRPSVPTSHPAFGLAKATAQ